jgi:hypothetical protein
MMLVVYQQAAALLPIFNLTAVLDHDGVQCRKTLVMVATALEIMMPERRQ